MRDFDLLLASQAVYATWDGEVGDMRFAVHRDLCENGLVIALQGTSDVAQICTDLHSWPKVGPDGHSAHAGITDRAVQLREALAAVLGETKVVFVGHSLGAGVAQRLAALMGGQCVAFEPPAMVHGFGLVNACIRGRAYCHANDPVPHQPPRLFGWMQMLPLIYFGLASRVARDAHEIAACIADAPMSTDMFLERPWP